jgi:modified peptide precursor CbpA
LKKNQPKKAIIATRKTCKATGTGLSHYVMMESAKAPKK